MDQDTVLTGEFQKILLNSASLGANSVGNLTTKDSKRISVLGRSLRAAGPGSTDLEDASEDSIDPQIFDKWVPFLRDSIENDQLTAVAEELNASLEENFQGLESQILSDLQVSDKLTKSISQVANIQSSIENSLAPDVQNLQNRLNSSTSELILRKQAFVNNKKTSLKISEAIILITKVVRILELSSKCQELITDRNFFKALQNLDNLEKLYLQEFKNYQFNFLRQIYDSIPFLKGVIKDECINLIRNSFNSNLGRNLLDVGTTVFEIYNNELLPRWLEKKQEMKLTSFKFNSPVEVSLRSQETLEKLTLENFFNLDEFHDAIMIFQTLKEQQYLFSEFTTEYEFRKAKIIFPLLWKRNKISNISTTPGDISDDTFTKELSFEFLKEYLLRILGFLLYDINLNKSTDYILVDNNYNTTNNFWNGLVNRLYPYMKHYLFNIPKTEDDLNELKNFLCVYAAILENFKFDITVLYEILVSIFQCYCDLQIEQFGKEFQTLLDDDDFMPLTITGHELLGKILNVCWMKSSEQETLLQEYERTMNEADRVDQFSITLPFSPLYPMTCTLAKTVYAKLVNFISIFYHHDLYNLNNILVKTMDTVFNEIVNNKIRSKFDSQSREEISQILINLDYFIIAAEKFSDLMTKENILQNPDIEIRLNSIQQYTESRELAETKLIELIDSKISDILDMVDLDWHAKEIRHEPDISIIDVAQFLEMMFGSTLVNLPYNIQTLLIFREFDSLTRKVLDILLHESPARITQQSVLNFETDIKYLQGIIPKVFPSAAPQSPGDANTSATADVSFSSVINDSDYSPALVESNMKSLEETFTELNQSIELLKCGSFADYMDPEKRMKKFSRIKPEMANILLSKVGASYNVNTNVGNLTDDDVRSMQDSTTSTSPSARLAKFFRR